MNKTAVLTVLALLLPTAASATKTTPATAMSCAQMLKTKVNLNKAPEAALTCLKGVKPAVAKDIIANRPFKDASDFGKKIEDIGQKILGANTGKFSF